MSLEVGLDEDLPADARTLIEATSRAIEVVSGKAEREAHRIRQKADRDLTLLQEKRDESVQALQQELAEKLKPLQTQYAREGLLDEALAIRAEIRRLRQGGRAVEPGPDTLEGYVHHVGRSFLFEVVGQTGGPLWGTDLYTLDSKLAAAVVHAGLLSPGERGVVRVELIDTHGMEFEGSCRNRVVSEPWDDYEVGFRVSRP